MELYEIKGVGEKTIEKFNKKKIKSVDDLIFFYPVNYHNFETEKQIVIGTISSRIKQFQARGNLIITKFSCQSELGEYEIVVFNQRHLWFKFKKNDKINIYVQKITNNQIIASKIVHNFESNQKILPIYSKIDKMSNEKIAKIIKNAIMMSNLNQVDKEKILEIHQPKSLESLSSAIYYFKKLEFNKYYQKVLRLQQKSLKHCENYHKKK